MLNLTLPSQPSETCPPEQPGEAQEWMRKRALYHVRGSDRDAVLTFSTYITQRGDPCNEHEFTTRFHVKKYFRTCSFSESSGIWLLGASPYGHERAQRDRTRTGQLCSFFPPGPIFPAPSTKVGASPPHRNSSAEAHAWGKKCSFIPCWGK